MVLILAIAQLVLCVGLIIVVLFQPGKQSGLSGAIAGMADTFMAKNKARTWDARLAKITSFLAITFVILTVILNIIK